MDKQTFLTQLNERLSGLPQDELEERLAFYNEMIDDRMEDGLSEEDAVAEIGPVEAIASQILAETPLPRLVRERIRPQKPRPFWEILLLILGAPLWIPLLIAAVAIVFSAYVVIWAVIVSLWAVNVSLAVSAIAGPAAGALFIIQGNVTPGLLSISAGLVLAGLSIFLFLACRAVTVGALHLTKKIAMGIKSLFLRKESVQ